MEPAAEPYADAPAQVLAELERLDLLLGRQVRRLRRLRPSGEAGLFVSEADVDAWLARPGAALASPAAEPDEAAAAAALDAVSARLAARAAASRARGVALPLDRLAEVFGLDTVERDLLLIALAPDLDRRYGHLFAFLQDDAARRRPRVDLAFALLRPGPGAGSPPAAGFGPAAMVEARRRLAPGAPLRRNRLVALVEEPGLPPLPDRELAAEDGVAEHLLGLDGLAPALAGWVRRAAPRRALADLRLPPEAAARLAALARAGLPTGGLVLHLRGPHGSGRASTAEALAGALGLDLLAVDGARAALMPEAELRAGLGLLRREAVLRRAAVLWEGFDALLDEAHRSLRGALLAVADGVPLTCLAGERAWEPSGGRPAAPCLGLRLPVPGTGDRLALWRTALDEAGVALAEEDAALLAAGFRLTGGQIHDAAAAAAGDSRWRVPAAAPALADLQAACRRQASRHLTSLGQKVEPRRGWGDLVLPADRVQLLRDVTGAVRHRARVFEDWGFGARLSLGKGVVALFSGPSGTGKTLAAEVIARDLALDLYRIDLSALVSKYIGETEKNLSRIFAEAEAADVILFFDEADALFGRRSEVSDAHDRYANIETSYLLQRLEAHEGLVILTTNFRKNMDEAFTRRIHTTVEFPVPTDADRRRLWSTLWPAATPLGGELDYAALARFELPGGNIRNAALAAAHRAAAEGGAVTMEHLVQAAQRELQKMGGIADAGRAMAPARARGA